MRPVPFENIVLQATTGADTERFFGAVDTGPNENTPFFPGNYVKRMCIKASLSLNDAIRALTECPNLAELACWTDDRRTVALPPLISPLILFKLSIEQTLFHCLPITDATECRWYQRLTHLELVFQGDNDIALDDLRMLPSLTHVCLLQPDRPVDHLKSIVQCRNLDTVIISGSRGTQTLEEIAKPYDVHLVLVDHWFPGNTKRGLDVWAFAEKEILRWEAAAREMERLIAQREQRRNSKC